jgi:hypothetical protein
LIAADVAGGLFVIFGGGVGMMRRLIGLKPSKAKTTRLIIPK